MKPKRLFRKLKGVSKGNDEYAQQHNRRPFVFAMTCADGGTIESQGSVSPDKCKRLLEIFEELQELHKTSK
jgi:hypothetical protein